VGRRTVLFIEDQTVMRVLVTELLQHAGFDVSSHADATSALEVFDAVDPDVLVTDIELGSRPNGAEAAVIARHRAPHLAVVFLTNFPLVASAPRAVASVPDATFLRKESLTSGADLVAAVDETLRQSRRRMSADSLASDAVLTRLTRGQLEVLQLIAQGHSNAVIAERSGRSIRAVERMIARLFDALEVNSDSDINPRVVAANRYARTFGIPTAPSITP